MTRHATAILQLDFDGTLVEGDPSTGILEQYVAPEWTARVEAASSTLRSNPDSTALIDTMTAGYRLLGTDLHSYLAFVHANYPARRGLRELIDTATSMGIETHVVSNGFEFYIREHLQSAGVESHVIVHTGVAKDGTLTYAGPDDKPVRSRFKERWTQHFLHAGASVIYVGDGTSDIAAATLCDTVFARDSLLTGLREAEYKGTLLQFHTLLDVEHALETLVAG